MKLDLWNIIFWTTNNHKIKEASSILWFDLKWYWQRDLDLIESKTNWKWVPEIQSMSIKEVVEAKAKAIYDILSFPVLVEDTWYFIEELKWFPGPFVKYIVDENWPWINLLFKMMEWVENRNIFAQTGFSIYDWENYYTWIGTLKWKIPLKPRWNQYWWSNAFEVDWLWLTFWEITPEHKNQISMRMLALKDFLQKIKD